MIEWCKKQSFDSPRYRQIFTEIQGVAGTQEVPLKDFRFKVWELPHIVQIVTKHFEPPARILDFGAGKSPLPAYFDRLGYDAYCVDLPEKRAWHPEVDEKAYNRAYGSEVTYFRVDIHKDREWIKDNYFDVIYSASVLEHMSIRRQEWTIMDLLEKLRPHGIFLHVIDYPIVRRINTETDICKLIKMVNTQGKVTVGYDPKLTPGCDKFVGWENVKDVKSLESLVVKGKSNSRICMVNDDVAKD